MSTSGGHGNSHPASVHVDLSNWDEIIDHYWNYFIVTAKNVLVAHTNSVLYITGQFFLNILALTQLLDSIYLFALILSWPYL